MSAAAKYNEETRWLALLATSRFRGVEGGKHIEETKLRGLREQLTLRCETRLTKVEVTTTMVKAHTYGKALML